MINLLGKNPRINTSLFGICRILFLTVCLFLLFTPVRIKAQSYTCYDSIEISRVDLTKAMEFNGLTASFFGVKLGMKIKSARDSANNFKDCHVLFEQDKYNNNRFYLYEIPPKGKRITLAYLIWPQPDSGLKEIIIFETARECMHGLTSKLFSCESLDSTTNLFRDFFGKPSFSKVELEIPALHLKTTRYYYPQLALILVESVSDDKNKYQLVLYNSRFEY